MSIIINSFTPSASVATVTEQNTLTMSVDATETGGVALLYRWEIKSPGSTVWQPISGATTSVYTTDPVSFLDDATYYRVVVFTISPNQQEIAPNSNGIELNVVAATIILYLQELNDIYSVTNVNGNLVMTVLTTLSGIPSGDESAVGGISYQWQKSTDSGLTWSDVVTNANIIITTTTVANFDITPTLFIRDTTLIYNGVPFSENLNRYRVTTTSALATNSPNISSTATIIVCATINITKQPGTGGDVTTIQKYNPADSTSGFTTLTISASSTAGSLSSLTYEWQYSRGDEYLNFSNAPGAFQFTGENTDTLYLYEIEYGSYLEVRCVVTGTAGEIAANSTSAFITTQQLVVMSSNVAASLNFAEGSTATFTALVNVDLYAGTSGDINTKWQKLENGSSTWTDITSYTISPVAEYTTPILSTTNDNGDRYRLEVDGENCTNEPFYSPDINGSVLSVFSFLTLETSPSQIVVFVNQAASFFAEAISSNGASLTYQWQISINSGSSWSDISNGGIYSGATTNLLLIDNVILSMDGYLYRCIMSAAGIATSVTSGGAFLLVQEDVFTFISSLNDQYLRQNDALSFSVTAQSASLSAISYQWQKSTDSGLTWSNISGATVSDYIVSSVSPSDTGYYRCALTSTGGTISYTNIALVDVVSLAISITLNNSTSIQILEFVSNALTLSVDAQPTVNADLTYQWQYNTNPSGNFGWSEFGTGFDGSSPNLPSYVPQPFSRSQTGLRIRCKVTADTIPGDWYSLEAVITVNRRFSYIPIPQSIKISANEFQTIDLALTTTGGLPIYQWQYRNTSSGTWSDIAGYTTQALDIIGYSASQLPTAGAFVVQNNYQIRCIVAVNDATQYQFFTSVTGLLTNAISPAGASIVVNKDISPDLTATVALLSAAVEPTKYSFETSKVGAAIGTIVCIPKSNTYSNPGITGLDDSVLWCKPHKSVATASNAEKLKYDKRFVGWIPVSATALMTSSDNMTGALLDANEFPELARIIGSTFGGSLSTYTASTGFLPPKTGTDGTGGSLSGTFGLPLLFGKKLFGTGRVSNTSTSSAVTTKFSPTGSSGSLDQVGYIGGDYNYDEIEQLPPGSTPDGIAGTSIDTPSTFTLGRFTTHGWENVTADLSVSYSEFVRWSVGPLVEKKLNGPTQHSHSLTSFAAVPENTEGFGQKIGYWSEVDSNGGFCAAKQVTPFQGSILSGVPYIDSQVGHTHGISLTDASAEGLGHGAGRGAVGSDTLTGTITQEDTGAIISDAELVMSRQSNNIWNSQLIFKFINAEKIGIITPQFRLKYYIKAW